MSNFVKQAAFFFSLLLLFLLPASEAYALNVPFPNQHTVEGGFDYAAAVYAADIDRDGDMDMIGAARNDNDIVWWENKNGEGTSWNQHTVDSAFEGAHSVVAADIDRDGDLDLVGAAQFDDDVMWWENQDGNGDNWGIHTVDGDFDGAHSVAVSDIDGDGDMDIVAAALDANDITWWKHHSSSSSWEKFTIAGDFGGAVSVHAADMDGDGDVDILGAAQSANDVTWWENNQSGTSWDEHTIDAEFDRARAVYATDMDGDGDMDALGAGSDNIVWWENQGGNAQSWEQHSVDREFDAVTAVYASDLDRDGDQDVLASGGNNMTWWQNSDGNGQSWQEYTVDNSFNGAEFVYVADMNGDGRLDILGAAKEDDDITWWENKMIYRNLIYPTEHQITQTFQYAASLYAADIDGDGDADLMGASRDNNEITWWENQGGSNWNEDRVEDDFEGAHSIVAADMDQDGDLDLLGAAQEDDEIAWWENENGNGNQWDKHTITSNFDGAHAAIAVDMDRDGDLDVLSAAFSAGHITWWENQTGNGQNWLAYTVDSQFPNTPSVHASDINGDGNIDIVAAGDNSITWWDNRKGNGLFWNKHTITQDFSGARSVYAADMDGDGDADIVGAAALDNKVVWWENDDGDGSDWDDHTIDSSVDAPTSLYAIDMDQDGDLDLVGSARSDDAIIWWENENGNARTWDKHIVDDNFDGAESAYAADIDGDGDIDLAGAASDDNTIAWWENRGGQFVLATTNTAPAIIRAGTRDDMFKLVASHKGRSGDHDAELATLALLFEQDIGNPLSDSQANAIIENLYVYLDNGSNTFEAGNDMLITTVETLSLSAGVQTISFNDGDSNVRVEPGNTRTYFVVVELTANADSQSPNTFRVTHLTESRRPVEDREFDMPLLLENPSNVTAVRYTKGLYLPAVMR